MKAETEEMWKTSVPLLTEIAKQRFPSLKLIEKKKGFVIKIKANRKYEWEVSSRTQLICVLSGLISAYEILKSEP